MGAEATSCVDLSPVQRIRGKVRTSDFSSTVSTVQTVEKYVEDLPSDTFGKCTLDNAGQRTDHGTTSKQTDGERGAKRETGLGLEPLPDEC